MENNFVPAVGPRSDPSLLRRPANGADDYWRGICEERTRIGCELHDGLFPHLNAAVLRLQNMAEELLDRTVAETSGGVALRAELAAVQALLTRASEEMRAWLRDQPAAAASTENLEETIRRIIAAVEKSAAGACRIHLKFGDGIPPLCPRTRWELACIGQEAIRNATRHGCARTVEVSLEHLPTERRVSLRVRDDGCGFDLRARLTEDRTHFGLSAMRLRAERLGGSLFVESFPGVGTTVTSSVPTAGYRVAPPRHFPGHEDLSMGLDH